MGLKGALKNIDTVLGLALGVSFILHALLFTVITTVEFPPPPSQADYTDWVKKIATPRREAIVLPPPVKTGQSDIAQPIQKQEEQEAKPAEKVTEKNEGAGPAQATDTQPRARGARATSQGGKQAGVEGGGSKDAVRQRIGKSGVLGVIGVGGGGNSGAVADVFSSTKAVSDDASRVGSGGQGGSLPSGDELESRGTKGVAAPSSQVADIGKVGPAVKANGATQVKTGSRKEAELKPAKIGSGSAEAISGTVDRKSMSDAISKKASGFRRCYERGLNANPELAGKLVFEITIDANGKVVDVRFTEDTLRSSEVVDCIKGILTRISFSNTGTMATFKSSLFFEPPR